jgi:hypothetical protein
MSRYYRIVEQQIDVFITICERYIEQRGLKGKVWVTKDEEMSVVGIGDPDKLKQSKDYGFVFYYEMIIGRDLQEVVDEFKFKLDHFIKHANSSSRFKVFRNEENKQRNQEN